MADADTSGMALIQAITPMVVAAAMTAGGCLVIGLAGYPLTAGIVAVAAAVCAVLGAVAARPIDNADQARSALCAELVTAVDAWPDMASLGAADQLARRTLRRIAAFEGHRFRQAASRARTAGTARALTAAALLLTVALAAGRGASAATLVFLALLCVGVMGSAERLAAAIEARALASQAGERLKSADHEWPLRPAPSPAFPGGLPLPRPDRVRLLAARHPGADGAPGRIRSSGRPDAVRDRRIRDRESHVA
jgi:ATP-binding cassette, subfamily C, bacterial CydC